MEEIFTNEQLTGVVTDMNNNISRIIKTLDRIAMNQKIIADRLGMASERRNGK